MLPEIEVGERQCYIRDISRKHSIIRLLDVFDSDAYGLDSSSDISTVAKSLHMTWGIGRVGQLFAEAEAGRRRERDVGLEYGAASLPAMLLRKSGE